MKQWLSLFAMEFKLLFFGRINIVAATVMPLLMIIFQVVSHRPAIVWNIAQWMASHGISLGECDSILTWTMFYLWAGGFACALFFVILSSGFSMARDVESGVLRTLLVRPVSRTTLITAKYVACLLNAVAIMVTTCLVAPLVAGFFSSNVGPLFSFARYPALLEADLATRYTLYTLLSCLSAAFSASLAFMCSCLPLRQGAATALPVVIYFSDYVMSNLPAFEPYANHFLFHRLGVQQEVLLYIVEWDVVLESSIFLAAGSLIFLVGSWASIQCRDFK